MTAEVHLDFGRKPAEMDGLLVANEECCLRKIIFCRDALKNLVRQPLLQRANAGRISPERLRGERVNVIIGYAHSCSFRALVNPGPHKTHLFSRQRLVRRASSPAGPTATLPGG